MEDITDNEGKKIHNEITCSATMLQSKMIYRTTYGNMAMLLLLYTLLVNISLFCYFIPLYIDKQLYYYLTFPLAISSIVITVWILYSHHLGEEVIALYPEMLYFEYKCKIPDNYGTMDFFTRHYKELEKIRESKFNSCQKVQCFKELFRRKRLGSYGHIELNNFALISLTLYLIIISYVVLITFFEKQSIDLIHVVFWFIVSSAIIYIWKCRGKYQNNPTENDVKNVISEIEKEIESHKSTLSLDNELMG